jgi:hypothetical protein
MSGGHDMAAACFLVIVVNCPIFILCNHGNNW